MGIDMGKRPYRLKCRFKIEPRPTRDSLKNGVLKTLDLFAGDMGKRGYEYAPKYGIRLDGPFVPVVPITVRRPQRIGSREMLPGVMQGNRYRDAGGSIARTVTPLSESEYWEYELAAVFIGNTILMETPDPHEEREMIKNR